LGPWQPQPISIPEGEAVLGRGGHPAHEPVALVPVSVDHLLEWTFPSLAASTQHDWLVSHTAWTRAVRLTTPHRLLRLEKPSGAAYFFPQRFARDGRLVLVGHECANDEGQGRTWVGLWDLMANNAGVFDFPARSCTQDVQVDPTGRLMLSQLGAHGQSELWELGGVRPRYGPWTCLGGVFSEAGDHVLCEEDGASHAYDVKTGNRAVTLGDRVAVRGWPRSRRLDERALPCGARIAEDDDTQLLDGQGHPFARWLDFGGEGWALVTTEGNFIGSPSVERHIAWFHLDGSLATPEEVAARRSLEKVRERMERALGC